MRQKLARLNIYNMWNYRIAIVGIFLASLCACKGKKKPDDSVNKITNTYKAITLDADSADVKSLFLEIHSQTGLGINVFPDALNGANKVTIHVKDKPFIRFLDEDLCKDQPFDYKISESSLVISRKI